MKNVNKKYLISSGVITALVIVAVIIVNMLATTVTSKFDLKFDLTRHNEYKLSDITKDVLSELEEEVDVKVLNTEEECPYEIKEYLGMYSALNNNFKVEFVDVYKSQAYFNEYAARGVELSENDIILECGERYNVISYVELYMQTYSFIGTEANYKFSLESKLTNGLVGVSGQLNEIAVYYMQGHGETLINTVAMSLSNLGFKNEPIDLIKQDIPEDAGLIISTIPTTDFTEEECKKLSEFFDRGGNFMIIFTPGMPELENVNVMLEAWGIRPNYDLVLEKDVNKIYQYENIMFSNVYPHNITNSILNQTLEFISYNSSSFTILPTSTYNTESTCLIEASSTAIGKTNLESETTDFEEGDINGPLPLAVISQKYSPNLSKIAAIGSADTLGVQTGGNPDFLSGMISWLTNNEGKSLQIAPKIITSNYAEISNSTIDVMKTILIYVIPIIIILLGIIIWLRRRYL